MTALCGCGCVTVSTAIASSLTLTPCVYPRSDPAHWELAVVKEVLVKREWSPEEHPWWLAFEVDGGLQIRPQQYQVAAKMLCNPGSIVQVRVSPLAKPWQVVDVGGMDVSVSGALTIGAVVSVWLGRS